MNMREEAATKSIFIWMACLSQSPLKDEKVLNVYSSEFSNTQFILKLKRSKIWKYISYYTIYKDIWD